MASTSQKRHTREHRCVPCFVETAFVDTADDRSKRLSLVHGFPAKRVCFSNGHRVCIRELVFHRLRNSIRTGSHVTIVPRERIVVAHESVSIYKIVNYSNSAKYIFKIIIISDTKDVLYSTL